MKRDWRWLYVVFFLVMIAIVRGQSELPSVLERTRLGGDGLLPLPCLMLKSLGALSRPIPVVMALLFGFSWRFPVLNSACGIGLTGTALFLLLSGYTLTCLMVILLEI